MALTRYMPWLAKTFLQGALSLARCCCRHCWTAVSSFSCFRQKREASREQACCSCGVPRWLPCADAKDKPDHINKSVNANLGILFSSLCGHARLREAALVREKARFTAGLSGLFK